MLNGEPDDTSRSVPSLDEREGIRYRVVYEESPHRRKQVVVTFLRQEGNDYVFDTAPKAGTMCLRVQDVSFMIQTEMPLQPWPMSVGTGRRR